MERTNCDCKMCQAPCSIMPGYLVPSDIIPYMNATGFFEGHPPTELVLNINEMLPWAKRNLLASEGGVVSQDFLSNGKEPNENNLIRIPTLVPAQGLRGDIVRDNQLIISRFGGHCVHSEWTGSDYICLIHHASPFGCRMFDLHMSAEDAAPKAREGLVSVLEVWRKAMSDDEDLDEGDEMSVEEGIYVGLWCRLNAEGYKRKGTTNELRAEVEDALQKLKEQK